MNKIRKSILITFTLCSVGVLCMAQSTVVRYLNNLRDVTITSASNGEVLTYSSGSGKWVNSAASGGATFNNNQFSSAGSVTNIKSGVTLTNALLYGSISLPASEASPTNVVDLTQPVATNVLNAALTILHATNGATGFEQTQVRWFWAGGADRTLTIPSAWKTNANSAVPASITNGWITKMYVTSIGDTGSSANQSNVFVSFEYYQ